MKLITFDSKTMPALRVNSTLPKVTFSKSGTISINGPAAEKIGVKHGDGLSIAQDSDAPENWYLFRDADGYTVRAATPPSKNLIFNNASLCKTFKEAMSLPNDETVNFLIGGQPTVIKGVKYWGILIPNN